MLNNFKRRDCQFRYTRFVSVYLIFFKYLFVLHIMCSKITGKQKNETR